MKGYMRLVPKEESEFFDMIKHRIRQIAQDEGIAWHVVYDSKEISKAIGMIADRLWYIKNNVKPSQMDLMNTKAEREKMKKEIQNATPLRPVAQPIKKSGVRRIKKVQK